MRVNWPGGVGPAPPRRGIGAATSDTAFTLATTVRSAGDASGWGVVGAAAGLGAMLAVQAVDEPVERRRRAVRRGHTLLDRLEELRLGLLEGAVPMASLQRLRMELAGGDPTDDPALRAVLEGIELRAAVELAKLEAGGAPGGA